MNFDCDFYGSGLEYDEGGDDFSTVLMLAICKEDVPMVRLLLEHGANVHKARPNFKESNNSDDEDSDGEQKETPLLVAQKTGNAAIIELLKVWAANAMMMHEAIFGWADEDEDGLLSLEEFIRLQRR
eukprot:SAG11_NODE_6190_length_1368_cov_1.386919_1_plen_127_part_00